MSTNNQLEDVTKQVYDFDIWLQAENDISMEEFSDMSKYEKNNLRKQYNEYLKQTAG